MLDQKDTWVINQKLYDLRKWAAELLRNKTASAFELAEETKILVMWLLSNPEIDQ
jgi:hypothetical protein